MAKLCKILLKKDDNIHKSEALKTVGQSDINTFVVSELNNQKIHIYV